MTNGFQRSSESRYEAGKRERAAAFLEEIQVLILQVSNRYGESEAGRQWGFIEREGSAPWDWAAVCEKNCGKVSWADGGCGEGRCFLGGSDGVLLKAARLRLSLSIPPYMFGQAVYGSSICT